MSKRMTRTLTCGLIAGLAVLAVAVTGSAASTVADRALLTRCLKTVFLGAAGHRAVPADGSGAMIATQFAVFRRLRSAADALPASAGLGAALGRADATSYDPTALVRLRRRGAGAIYAVPATIAAASVPTACRALPQLAGIDAFTAAETDVHGVGPGACLITTYVAPYDMSGVLLPGARPPRTRSRVGIGAVTCLSASLLTGYEGALGLEFATGPSLVRDGVSTITYARASGATDAVPVSGNVAQPPASLALPPTAGQLTAAAFAAELESHLPTTITESGPSGSTVATLSRPPAFVSDAVAEFAFLSRLVARFPVTSGSSSTVSTGASCRAQTHRCVAVTVATTCNSHDRCRTTRRIDRYRYVGSRPPRGTTGPNTLPTAPIVGRTDRLVRRPGRLSLVLSGTPQAHAVVIVAATCFAPHTQAAGGGPALTVAVPSRTRIALPGPARAFRACDIGVLVTSTRPGPVHARVVRG